MPGNRMRTPRGRGRNMNSNQGGQGFGSGGNRPMMASGGPLMTNHIELHELDLELALLKRKREMIEKQHTMLVSESRFGGSSQYGFNQASQSYGQRSEPTRNFSNFYNDVPGQQYDRFNTQQGVKRPAIDPWDNSAPKRFNAPSGPKRTTSRYEPRPARSQPASQPPPLMNSSFRQRRPGPTAPRTNFKPTKVTKPRQNTAPNKLNSYPVADRKNLVNKASNLVQKSTETLVYEADKPANPKLLGRLELALGNILREMRETYGDVEPHNLTFTNLLCQRALKQAIRERIRAIMLGKPVGAGGEIVALYRKEHPKDTDVEFLDKARESIVHKGNLAIDIIKQGNPERYFRNNFRRLLHSSLDEMFERMQKLYSNVDSGKPLQEVIDGLTDEIQKSLEESNVEPKGPEDTSENVEASQLSESTEIDNSVVKSDENGAAAVEDTNATSEEVEKSDENAAKSDENAAKTENAEDNNENEKKPEENAAQPEQNGDTPVKNADKKAKPVLSSEEYVRARFYNRLMENLLKRNLPLVLPRYKDFILRIINTDAAFRETKAYLVKTTNEKVDERAANKATPSPAKSTSGGTDKKTLFVKVMGRPGLPKKKLMKAFLDTFHPTLIKKHRTMHNVLFISFDSQENFDNILAANGTIIANCRLAIRVSENINRNKPNQAEKANDGDAQEANDGDAQEANDGDAQEEKPEAEAKLETDVEMGEAKPDADQLNESLDDQIDDLLSSIREEEDKKDNESQEGQEQEEKEINEEPTDNEGESQNGDITEPEKKDEEQAQNEETDKVEAAQKDVEAVKNEATAKGTPTRSSARLTSTPSTIRTRRASKLTQN